VIDLGQLAYDTYRQTSSGESLALRIVGWDELPPDIREAWLAAANAVKIVVELKIATEL
jgi:hypothetical protein